jgi:hypothetical protein
LTVLFFRGILPGMRGFQTGLAMLCVLAGAAAAQTNPPARTVRQYDSRIQMHTAPTTLQVPDDSLEMQKGAPESTDHEMMAPRNVMLQDDTPQETQIRPHGPRPKASQEKQQNKNWILPSSTETEKKDEKTTSKQQEEAVPSGWGWLADDVQARQQKQKDDEEDSDSKDKDKELGPRSDIQKEEGNRKTDGIFSDTAFKPVSSSTSTKDNEKNQAEDASARDESPEGQKRRPDGPTTVESPRNRTSADQPREQKTGADATWGNESLWSKNAKSVSTLPQTEALLSISKLDTRKEVSGSDRTGFKPDAGIGTIHRVQPDPARRNFVTAASFQPLAAAPVNDLGNTPWDGGPSAGTPFGGSTPFSQEPVVTPSQPTQPTRALALPQPVASPWLR